MKKIAILTLLLFCAVNTFAQKYSEITGKTTNYTAPDIKLFEIKDGRNVELASTRVSADGNFGFKIIIEREGFYTLGQDKVFVTIYLKQGDDANINIDNQMFGTLFGKNSKENIELYKWESPIAEIVEIANTKTRNGLLVNYEKFFPLFNERLPQLMEVKAKIKAVSPTFDRLMQVKMNYDLDYYCASFIRSGRTIHPTYEQYPEYLKNMHTKWKITTDEIMDLPNGAMMISRLADYHRSILLKKGVKNADYMKSAFEIFQNDRLRGEFLIENVKIKTYPEYEKFVEQYGRYMVTESLKKRLEKICGEVSNKTEGTKAANFTYPDANGKMHSLSDYKGKVVVIDVWASWCGPCKKEMPNIKKLEHEFKGNSEVVFIGISIDDSKGRDKWLETIKKYELDGIQLHAADSRLMAEAYGATSIPRFIIIDKSGNLHTLKGPRPSDPGLKRLILEALKK